VRSLALASLLVVGGVAAGCHWLVGTEERSVGEVDAALPDASAPPDAAPSVDASPDVALDAGPSPEGCDPTKPFDSPVPVVGVNTVGGEFGVTLSQDELEIFYTSTGASGGPSLVYRATRAAIGDRFEGRAKVDLVGLPASAWGITLSPDGKELLVSAGARPRRIYRAFRPAPGEPFGPAEIAPFLGSAAGVAFDTPAFGGEGILYLSREQGPQFDMFFGFRDDAGATSAPRSLAAFNTPGTSEDWPVESLDGTTLFFSSGGLSATEIVEARRASRTEPYPIGRTLSFPQSAFKHPGFVSRDGCRLYLVMENAPGGGGGSDVFVASRGRATP
jgi:hypothetical protein